MNQTSKTSLCDHGTPLERVDRAVAQLAAGRGILVMDDEHRENEGDLIFAADTLTTEQMTLMIREGTGIVCLSLPDETLRALELPQMVADNSSSMGTAFTVSIEARTGVTTGVSSADRVTTIRAAIAPDARPDDLARPGHVFPLRAHPGGVLARGGHTEAALELVTMAGHSQAAVLCELMNADGTMARRDNVLAFARHRGMAVVTIADLTRYLTERKSRVA